MTQHNGRQKYDSTGDYPESKGHVLRSAAATIFDGKPPKLLSTAFDNFQSNSLNNDLITATQLVMVDSATNQFTGGAFNPNFNSVPTKDLNESEETGTVARMLHKD